jgi:hypothetical protein
VLEEGERALYLYLLSLLMLSFLHVLFCSTAGRTRGLGFSNRSSAKGPRNKRALVNAGYRVLLSLFPPFKSRSNALAEREKFSAGKGG